MVERVVAVVSITTAAQGPRLIYTGSRRPAAQTAALLPTFMGGHKVHVQRTEGGDMTL